MNDDELVELWYFTHLGDGEFILRGHYNGKWLSTSLLTKVHKGHVVTRNGSVYQLGKPDPGVLEYVRHANRKDHQSVALWAVALNGEGQVLSLKPRDE